MTPGNVGRAVPTSWSRRRLPCQAWHPSIPIVDDMVIAVDAGETDVWHTWR